MSHQHRRSDVANVWIVRTLLAGLIVLVLVLGWQVQTLNDPWDPLGDYPTQEVLEVTDEYVLISGTKCNDSEAPVEVRGEFSWRRVDPLGFLTLPRVGGTTRIPGCETQEFMNDIPDEVKAVDGPGVVWAIVGQETPFDGSREGVTVTWTSANFVLTES